MHDDLNAVEGNVVEEVCLDDLQALVDQGRGVHGDDRAHGPGGVREGVGGRHVRQFRLRTAPERASGGGDDELAHVGPGAGGEGLEEGGVLGVDRDDLARLRHRLHQRAADDERLLVGEREGTARLQGGEGRGEADGAGDAVENGVAPRGIGGGELGGRVRAGEDLGEGLPRAVRGGQGLAQRRYDVPAGDGDGPHAQAVRLLGQQLHPPSGGGEPGHAEAVRVAQDEVDGLGADRAGRSEDHYVPCAVDRVEDEMRIGERGWTVAHPPIVAASGVRQDRAPH